MKINELKDFNKPINKLIQNGVESLSNEELLAILINTGTKNLSCLEISQKILNSLTSLNELLDLNIQKLMKFEGIKEKKAATIISSLELFKRASRTLKQDIIINNKAKFYQLIKPYVISLKVEHVFICYLDAKLHVIFLEEIKGGNPNNIVFPIRNIVKKALELDSVSVIIAHNHPSGDTMPSENDIEATEKLLLALNNVDINLIDHLVVSKEEYFSIFELIEK